MPKSPAQRIRDYRQRQLDFGGSDSSRYNAAVDRQLKRMEAHDKPFAGCDGEGAGVDALGRQLYLLFYMGNRELFTGEHLTTAEILDFICDHPDGSILVGFAFGYDVTMILRDLPEAQLRRLFLPKGSGPGKSRYTWFKDFDIEYLPKQYFRVRRTRTTRTLDGKETRTPIEGSVRTIYETFGFFQKSFVKVIGEFDCGTREQRAEIAANKSRRSEFASMGSRERAYCAMECELLAELMSKLRDYCYAADIRPHSWNGAGKLAAALHKKHGSIERVDVETIVPKGVLDYANMAYYGGRFEITRTGMIGEKVYEYDIRSAYPDAMRTLPCIKHGRWEPFEGGGCNSVPAGLFVVVQAKFNHPDVAHGQMCSLPVRSKDGHLYWPLQGSGIYWSPELRAAELLGAKLRLGNGWAYISKCQCKSYDWVEPLFDYRASIGSKGPGYPIKLGINSLYGKTAQRVGNGKYANMIHAGLITALTRAKLLRAIALAKQTSVLMIATDAIYSTEPLSLDIGERLGQWEAVELEDLFIVQPGLYWSPDKRKKKSRGLPGKFFEEAGRTEAFERQWSQWKQFADVDFPTLQVPLQNFIGLKVALARNKPELAGTWVQEHRNISFDYRNKREGHRWLEDAIITSPKPGSSMLVSLPHRDFLAAGGHESWEGARAMLEDMPDYVDLSPPFKD